MMCGGVCCAGLCIFGVPNAPRPDSMENLFEMVQQIDQTMSPPMYLDLVTGFVVVMAVVAVASSCHFDYNLKQIDNNLLSNLR